MTTEQLRYRTATTALRCPRVVVLVPGFGDWRGWMRLAIKAASAHWGGGGYIYIPVSSEGKIHPDLLMAAIAYDPDYIAILQEGVPAWRALAPDRLQLPPQVGLSDDEYHQMLEASPVRDDWARAASADLVAACTPLGYARKVPAGPPRHISSSTPLSPQPFLPAPPPGYDRPYAALVASANWPGDINLMALARTGTPETSDQRDQPVESTLLKWVISQAAGDAPEELLWFSSMTLSTPARNHNTWFGTASPNLNVMWAGIQGDQAAVIVGDTADDFALAVALDRMLGYALWLTEDIVQKHIVRSPDLQYSLQQTWEIISPFSAVPLWSTSLDDDHLSDVKTQMRVFSNSIHVQDLSDADSDVVGDIIIRRPRMRMSGLRTLAMSDHLGEPLALPISEDDDGTLHVQTPVSSLLPEVHPDKMPLNSFGSPQWIVDVTVEGQITPTGRGLPSRWVVDDGDENATTVIRSSRAGVSFLAASLGVVSANQVLASRLASPRIRQLGMYSWVQAMAESSGVDARLSRPGRFANLVANRLGSRKRLVDLVASPMHPFLREFLPMRKGSSSAEVFPEDDGMLVNARQRILAYEALERLTPDVQPDLRRTWIDELLKARLLRQGLALNCEECALFNFISLDDIRQQFECKTCGALNEFAAARWKSITAEPRWFYDLHPALASLLADNGDVPLLAAHRLSAGARRYADTGEVEFRSLSDTSLNFEIDLIAHIDDQVVVLEAKTNGSLETGKSRHRLIMKRFRAAELLRADKVVFATTASEWTGDSEAIANKIARHSFPRIEVQFIAGLGPESCEPSHLSA
ncbi:hypothetical protein ACFQ9V_08615 [Leifsonia sp. NPDC056665]|uniref:hypothetical protein n=1 Tax=Leifsonia sp. NPDC056665 TaxID=3345901 RepID=UPI0036C30B4D